MKRVWTAVAMAAFVAGTTGAARAQVNVEAWVNFNWFNYSQATCLDRGQSAINQALTAFPIQNVTTQTSGWSIVASGSDLNFWVFCVADDDTLIDATAQRVLAVVSVNSGRSDIGENLRDYLFACMGGACPGAPQQITWQDNATQYRGQNGASFDFTCPALVGGDYMGGIWGTDTYTDDSAICTAAVHAGIITTSGGAVTIEIVAGQKGYSGSTRNGVTSDIWGAFDGSYRFVTGD